MAEPTRWLTEQGVPTRTGKSRWDRSVIWGMLRMRFTQGRVVSVFACHARVSGDQAVAL
ncbi:recombinase family protein [Nocardia sp. NBC_00881]|uniref:recombinase family protein n=1 Tax=Nocardia sp. NBC_00881 TaxID=2975995 RepID=UPI003868F8C3